MKSSKYGFHSSINKVGLVESTEHYLVIFYTVHDHRGYMQGGCPPPTCKGLISSAKYEWLHMHERSYCEA